MFVYSLRLKRSLRRIRTGEIRLDFNEGSEEGKKVLCHVFLFNSSFLFLGISTAGILLMT